MMDTFTFSTERKLKVFKALGAGPMRLDDLHHFVFHKRDGKQPCKRVFDRMVKKLKDGEYIDIIEWRDSSCRIGINRLAILRERGANMLCLNLNVERDHIRMKVPRTLHMRHELILSNVIRFLQSEERVDRYQIESMYDDTGMKRNLRLKGIKGKNLYLPDLRCKVAFGEGSADFCLELDCGQKGRKYWCQKLRSWSNPTLLIALNKKRAERLANYALNDTQRRGMVCAISLMDFYRVGLPHFKDALLNPFNKNVFLYGANI